MNKNTRMGKNWLLHLITTKRPSTVVVKNRIFQDLFSFQSGCYGGTTLSSCSMGRHKLYWQKVILQNKLPNSSTHRLCDPGGRIIRFIIFRKGFKNNKGIFYRSPHNKSFMENVIFLTKTTLKENSKKKFYFFESFPLTSCPFSSFQFFKFTCKLLIIYYSWLRLRERGLLIIIDRTTTHHSDQLFLFKTFSRMKGSTGAEWTTRILQPRMSRSTLL